MAKLTEQQQVMLGKGPSVKMIRNLKNPQNYKKPAFKHTLDTSRDFEYLDRPNFHPGRK